MPSNIQIPNKPWLEPTDNIFKMLETSEDGLSISEVQKRLTQYGHNLLPQERPFSSLKIFFSQFASPLIYFLIFAGIVTLFLKDYNDAIVIFAAVVLNAIVGFFQENKASKALSRLRKVLKAKATVIREGFKKEIFQEELAPGDLIVLKSGDKIPADGRIFESKDFKVSEASLTGEWLAVDKNSQNLTKDFSVNDRTNMVHMGTIVENGFAKAIVTETGPKTEVGKVALLVRETQEEETPYQKKLIQFGKVIGLIIIILSFLIFVLGILKDRDFIEIFTTSVAIAVAAVPEGLPIAMTVVLALGMQRILKRRGLVRRLAAAESLGSTSIICVDKTGTLTEGKMEVAHIYTGAQELFYDRKDNIEAFKDGKESNRLNLEIVAMCSEAYIENPQEEKDKWILRGRPTDRALTSAAIEAGIFPDEFKKTHPQIDLLEFRPDKKNSASLNRFSETENILYVMGAPEKILEKSALIKLEGRMEEIDQDKFAELEKKYHQLTGQGLRVLATAYKIIPEKQTKIEDQMLSKLNLVGFIALKDPLRAETKAAFEEAKLAGLRPIIVTGDHRLTAKAIAQELNLPTQEENIMEGQELSRLSDAELKEKIDKIQIFARVEPSQKLKIIEAWQAKNQVVAMTGDGINDAPALKKADIGLALGSGTEVAKEVADIVLLDDNFSIIIAAIEEGRAIIDNIRKSIVYLISDSFSEIALIGLSLIFGWPLPVLAAQILWINLIEDGLPTIALAFEPKEKDLMTRKPHSRDLPLLTKDIKILIFIIALVSVVILLGLYYYLLNNTSYEIFHIRTVIFTALTILTLFNVFSCKSLRKNIWQISPLSNIYLFVAWLSGILVLLLALYLPILQEFLKTEPLNSKDWLFIVVLGIINIILIELTKKYFINKEKMETKRKIKTESIKI